MSLLVQSTPNPGTDAPLAPGSAPLPQPQWKPGSFQKFENMQIA
jgi:hypothetical protein